MSSILRGKTKNFYAKSNIVQFSKRNLRRKFSRFKLFQNVINKISRPTGEKSVICGYKPSRTFRRRFGIKSAPNKIFFDLILRPFMPTFLLVFQSRFHLRKLFVRKFQIFVVAVI